ncbi:hypothetical protein GIB67_007729 [Kingdonia uniflora]|uniref:NB-ARC domain-containing protein n=1 Tax=Kingdonia uniflora TaxID=39325 RepID=A0A7J7N2E6_9MAGN|nr:hypothetical protein GIB67_007729 [Kingdonia uniflora]
MGGSGKSTLADKVYNVDTVKNHFEARAWINVSQVYDPKVLLQDLAKEFMDLKSEVSGKMTVEELKEKLREFLIGKKFLVVMDDVWTSDVWKVLKASFPDTKNGSRIVITTRIMEVAQQVDPVSPPHELKPLSNDDSWDLFTKKVIIAHDSTPSSEKCSFPIQLEEVGRKIVKKCGGLPLAIVLLGGLLIGKLKDCKAWSILLKRTYWQLSQDLTPCTQILALRYKDLPSYLKPCFLYLGIYPEDYEINTRRLIKMWIAEGFIVQRGNEIVEDIGEEYLEELAGRVLDLSYLSYFVLDEGLHPIVPKSLGKLVHLRYLWLSNVDVSNLKTIIRNLRNLDVRFRASTALKRVDWMNFKWQEPLNPNLHNYDSEMDIVYTREFIAYMMGNLFFSNGVTSLRAGYLAALTDYDILGASGFDWGTPIMAALYRGLDEVSVLRPGKVKKSITGFYTVLEYWFFEYCRVGMYLVKRYDRMERQNQHRLATMTQVYKIETSRGKSYYKAEHPEGSIGVSPIRPWYALVFRRSVYASDDWA